MPYSSTALLGLIDAAFSDHRYPGDDQIIRSSGGDADEVLATFRGTSWRGHSPRQLRINDFALSCLTEDALIYYVPAFLTALVEDPETADTLLDGILWLFTLPRGHKPWDLERFDRFIRRFSQPQREAVLAVFEHLQLVGLLTTEGVASLMDVFRTRPAASTREE